MKSLAGAAAIIAVLALAAACEVQTYRDCQSQGNSFLFCMRLLSR